MAVLFAVLMWMSILVPMRPMAENIEVATGIAEAVLVEPPLFKDDESRMKTAALIVAISFRESSFRAHAKSKTDDHCLMQINKRPDLDDDLVKCVRTGEAMLRESMRMCPDYPIAFYASGPGACTNTRAQAISRDRMAIAKKLSAEDAPKRLLRPFVADVAVSVENRF